MISCSTTTPTPAPPGVAGLARICKEAYPDATQFDAESRYYDGKSDPAAPRWDLVDMEHVETFAEPVSLERLKQAGELEGMLVIRRGMRLSVQPVDKDHFKAVLRMAGSNTRIR